MPQAQNIGFNQQPLTVLKSAGNHRSQRRYPPARPVYSTRAGWLVFALFAAAASGAEYEIRPVDGARMELQVEKTGFLRGKKHQFFFDKYHGTLQYSADKLEASRIGLTIDSNSATCRDTWVSAKDLRKIQEFALNDMLAADRFPTVEFVSNTIRQISPGRFQVEGSLTIRDIAKPVHLNLTLDRRQDSLWFTGTAVVRMTDYNLKPPSAALGTIGTKAEMPFLFTVAARQTGK